MKNVASLTLLLLLFGCSKAQQKNDSFDFFKKNYSRLNLEYFIFFELDLIQFSADSMGRNEFEKDFENEIGRIKESQGPEATERKIFLHVLYNRINSTITPTDYLMASKSFLLQKLSEFKELPFTVDFKLIEERLNSKKRGMPFGDEECDIASSQYIFFLYDAELYLRVITESRIANPSGEILFPTTCFLEELSYLPLELKKRTQKGILKHIAKFKGKSFDLLREKINKADLSAHYD